MKQNCVIARRVRAAQQASRIPPEPSSVDPGARLPWHRKVCCRPLQTGGHCPPSHPAVVLLLPSSLAYEIWHFRWVSL